MEHTTTTLSYVLVTLSALTLLSAEGQFPISAKSAPEEYVTIMPDSSTHTEAKEIVTTEAAPDCDVIAEPPLGQPFLEPIATETAPHVDVIPDLHSGEPLPEPTDTIGHDAEMATVSTVTNTSASGVDVPTKPSSTATPVNKEHPYLTGTPLKLVCPSSNPERFYRTSWHLITGANTGVGLYRINDKGVATRYPGLLPGLYEIHNLTNTKDLIIYDNTCNYTANYRCWRLAHAGSRIEMYDFHVANCSVVMKEDRRQNDKPVFFRNSSKRLMPWSVILAVGTIGQFIY